MSGIVAHIQDVLSEDPEKCLYVVNDAHCSNCGEPLPVPDYCSRWHGGRAFTTGKFAREVGPCECGGVYVFALEIVVGIGFSESCIARQEYVEYQRRKRAA